LARLSRHRSLTYDFSYHFGTSSCTSWTEKEPIRAPSADKDKNLIVLEVNKREVRDIFLVLRTAFEKVENVGHSEPSQ